MAALCLYQDIWCGIHHGKLTSPGVEGDWEYIYGGGHGGKPKKLKTLIILVGNSSVFGLIFVLQ